MRASISSALILAAGLFLLVPSFALADNTTPATNTSTSSAGIQFFPPSNLKTGGCNSTTALFFDGTHSVTCAPTIANTSCPSGEAVTSFSNGVPQCTVTIANTSCPSGEAVTSFSNGVPQCNTVASSSPPAPAPAPTLADNLYYVTPWGNVIQCSNGNCTFNNGTVPGSVVNANANSIEIQQADCGGGSCGTISDVFVSNGNYCGFNSLGSGGAYATSHGTLWVTSANPISDYNNTAGVTTEIVTSLAVVQAQASDQGCALP